MKKRMTLPALLIMLSLTSLTGCTQGNQIVKTDYIRQEIPSIPASPEFYPVSFIKRDEYYCIDAENARNLLKNRELEKGYQDELKEILNQIKGPKP